MKNREYQVCWQATTGLCMAKVRIQEQMRRPTVSGPGWWVESEAGRVRLAWVAGICYLKVMK